jgi:hypothetical protein
MEIIKASLMAAVGGGGSGANLGSVTFTENDTYTPTQPLDGWDEVTVQVPTYEDEYREALERIAELEEQVEECDQCKADVIAKLQEYDPNFDPQTCEDIPDEIGKVVDDEKEKVSGYTFPDGTPYGDIVQTTGGNPITDETTGVTVELIQQLNGAGSYEGQTMTFNFWTQIKGNDYFPPTYPYENTGSHVWYMKITANDTTYTWSPHWEESGGSYPIYNNEGRGQITSATIDPSTGDVEWIIRETYDGYPDVYTRRYIGTLNDLIGYGASGHTYKVHNT